MEENCGGGQDLNWAVEPRRGGRGGSRYEHLPKPVPINEDGLHKLQQTELCHATNLTPHFEMGKIHAY
jgi:hypothetical protein